MDKLKDAGYSCERMSVAGFFCTKPGEKGQVCDNDGKCAVLIGPRPRSFTLPSALGGTAGVLGRR